MRPIPSPWLAALCCAAASPAQTTIQWTLQGAGIERALTIEDGVLRTRWLRAPHETVFVREGELAVGLGDGRQLTAADFTARKVSDGEVELTGRGTDSGLKLRVYYETDPRLPVVWKRVAVEGELAGAVRWVAPEALACSGSSTGGEALGEQPLDLDRLGQPVVVADSLLAAVVHPAGRNQHDGRGTLRLMHYAPLDRARRTMLLLAPRDGLVRRFHQLVWASTPTRGVMTFLMPRAPTAEAALRAVTACGDSARLLTVALDDGWQEPRSFWEASRAGFPEGLAELARVLPAGAGLSVSLSLCGRGLDLAAEPLKDLERRPDRSLDPAGAGCEQAWTRRVQALAQDGVRHLRLIRNDQLTGTDPWALEAGTAATLRLLSAARAARLSTTLAAWWSPFWLLHADLLAPTEPDPGPALDMNGPALVLWDRAATRRDSLRHARLERAGRLLPAGAVSEPPAAATGETDLATFADASVHALLGGGVHRVLCLPEAGLDAARRDFLLQLLQWQHGQLAQFHEPARIPGDPARGELHGTVWAHGARALVWLRNPTVLSLEPTLPVGTLFQDHGSLPPRPAAARLYPRREVLDAEDGLLRIPLAPFASTLVLVGPADQLAPQVRDWPAAATAPRLEILGEGPNRAVVRYCGKTPGVLTVLLATELTAGTAPPAELTRDEQPVALRPGAARGHLQVATLPAEPGSRHVFSVPVTPDAPFPAQGWHRLFVLAEEPLAAGPGTGFDPQLPPLPGHAVHREGHRGFEMALANIPVPGTAVPLRQVATEAILRLDVFGSDDGSRGENWLVCGETQLVRLPRNEGAETERWETVEQRLGSAAVAALELARGAGQGITLHITNAARDSFKVRNIQLAFRFDDSGWALSSIETAVHCSDPTWRHAEGEAFVGERSKAIVLVLR